MVGGYTALAEGAWMGAAQASDVLEPLHVIRPRRAPWRPRLPRLRLRGLLSREFSIGEASVLLMASFLLSALLGAVRQVLFNADFGAGSEASAYYAAFRLPDTLFSLIAGGALSSAMIPVLLTTTREDGEEGAARLVNLVLSTLLAAFAVVVCLGELLAPQFVQHVLAPGFDHHTSRLATNLTRLMLIQPLILAVGSVATAILNSRNQFLLTALSIASHNIGLILGILATRVDPGLGVYGPTLGVVAGAVLQVLILLPGLRVREFRLRPSWNLRDRRLREVLRLLVPNGLAVGVGYSGFIVDTAFASTASEKAALPALHNAWLLVTLPIALLGQAVGQAAFPRLAAHSDARDFRQLRRTLLRSVGAVIALAVPAALTLLVLGRPTIRILFEHGKFHGGAGSLTNKVLVAYAFALPASVATEVLARGLIALRDTRTPLFANSVQLIGRATIMAIFVGSIGVIAVPIAFAAMAFVEALALAAVLLLRLRAAGQGDGPARAAASSTTLTV
jgi:putative peptidoglycan lipid II flippase